MKTKKLTTLAITVALAMVLSFAESRIPSFVPIPGVKIGLANLAVLFALYRLGGWEAATVSAVRVFLSTLLFGTPVVFLYSIAGAALSLLGMMVAKRFAPFSPVGVSVIGGVLHNVGQIAVAEVLLGSTAVFAYLPLLLVAGTVAGAVNGGIVALLLRRLK